MTSIDDIRLISIGALNTDISVVGVPRLPLGGEDVFGPRLLIGAGGKSRNAAEMAARLVPSPCLAYIGRTTRDALGLWQVPYEAPLQPAPAYSSFLLRSVPTWRSAPSATPPTSPCASFSTPEVRT